MTRYEPRVWGEHLNPTERVMVDDLIYYFRRRSEHPTSVEVQRTPDGRFRLLRVKRTVLDRAVERSGV